MPKNILVIGGIVPVPSQAEDIGLGDAQVVCVQTQRYAISPNNQYPAVANAALRNIVYIGIDPPTISGAINLKKTSTKVDVWEKIIAPPIASAATSVAATSFTANWANGTYYNGSAEVDEPISYYEIQYSTSSTFATGNTLVSAILPTSFTITGLTTATTYYYRVRAVNGKEVSDWSNTITRTTA